MLGLYREISALSLGVMDLAEAARSIPPRPRAEISRYRPCARLITSLSLGGCENVLLKLGSKRATRCYARERQFHHSRSNTVINLKLPQSLTVQHTFPAAGPLITRTTRAGSAPWSSAILAESTFARFRLPQAVSTAPTVRLMDDSVSRSTPRAAGAALVSARRPTGPRTQRAISGWGWRWRWRWRCSATTTSTPRIASSCK